MKGFVTFIILSLLSMQFNLHAQGVYEYKDSLVLSNKQVAIVVDNKTGRVSYRFSNGVFARNTIAYIRDVHFGYLTSADFREHHFTVDHIGDNDSAGIRINIKHTDDSQKLILLQHITIFKNHPYLLLSVNAEVNQGETIQPETNDISPITILPNQKSSLFIPGDEPRILDVPFDNDNWVNILECKWPASKSQKTSGISYEFSALYDNNNFSGLVIGSLKHDFWKTGIKYRTGLSNGFIDSLCIFGGAATEDDPTKKPAYGGLDGTHDHAPHGTMKDKTVSSPLIFLCGSNDIRKTFVEYGEVNVGFTGRLNWKGFAPFYWNSFGVENVLGNKGVMMPSGIIKISDFIQSLDNFNRYVKPVLNIDSYNQEIYTTDLLSSLSRYAKKKNQQMGFYFIPFALWTWKNSIDEKELPGTHYLIRDVVLRDKFNVPILYKDGKFCAYALDPTHPGVRLYIIRQIQKAKAINATFLKIDFLTAGSLESSVRYDSNVRSGMQAYNHGMKMLKSLIDSIMGPDIFITMAISPMFPSQYAHTRFVSTDVYSHLRDDQHGFPHYGSTEASLATGSHMWWVQGTLWKYTNMDVCIMKNFQNNPDLTEQEIKVRIYAMMVMGSILGDGSDFRNKGAADRANYFLNNKNICAFFSDPKVFTPLKFSDGESMDQQISFCLSGDTTMLAMFNFDTLKVFDETFDCKALGLSNKKYIIHDFLTDHVLGKIDKNQQHFELSVENKDAVMVRLVPVSE